MTSLNDFLPSFLKTSGTVWKHSFGTSQYFITSYRKRKRFTFKCHNNHLHKSKANYILILHLIFLSLYHTFSLHFLSFSALDQIHSFFRLQGHVLGEMPADRRKRNEYRIVTAKCRTGRKGCATALPPCTSFVLNEYPYLQFRVPVGLWPLRVFLEPRPLVIRRDRYLLEIG